MAAAAHDKDFKKKVDALADHKFFKGESAQPEQVDDEFSKQPMAVKYRVQCLRRMQLEEVQARAEMEEQLLILQQRYHRRLQKSFARRRAIVEGLVQPSPEEQLKRVVDDPTWQPSKSSIKGVPGFWATVLDNAEMASGWINDEGDKKALEKLRDIRIIFGDPECQHAETADGAGDNPEGFPELAADQFTIEFEFEKNEFFEDKVLRKTYMLGLKPEEEDNPFDYEGAVIKDFKGCTIQWKKDKCLSYKLITKKQRNPKTGATRTVRRKEKLDSFFNFFENLPEVIPDKDTEEEKEEKEDEIDLDHELGLYFRDKIIPNAVLMFTNEFIDDEIESDSEDDSDESEEDEESEEDDPAQQADDAEKPECNQQ